MGLGLESTYLPKMALDQFELGWKIALHACKWHAS